MVGTHTLPVTVVVQAVLALFITKTAQALTAPHLERAVAQVAQAAQALPVALLALAVVVAAMEHLAVTAPLGRLELARQAVKPLTQAATL
jgi:hypothetical protein